MPDNPDPSNKSNPFVTIARYSEIAFIVPAALFVGFGIGKALDYWLSTTWIYIPGAIFGAVCGFYAMIRRALSATRDIK